ncbi:CDA_G0012930.mRNA.1.CDS.1 [Saccharomyces cerevisiae]|nr:CDA_G0012930.mRNA.1.CDS.1 [Saccharomyces cerevisiae]CAI4382941.1 CCT_1a_G0013040.mRNA.1.CDS.1 [Saccharomyces cerevisiae]CAI7226256.1 CDA_G0012930.mRNA.1.CDS.1 [Saccharomyces cerevisiae]CAI7226657.1 CCT_1a_G0013040.mRNA.1.CDS.1 [Saccharomyces cerevisiae]
MSELHALLTFPERPISQSYYVPKLQHFLKSGIPATYTLEQVAAFEHEEMNRNGDKEFRESTDDNKTSNTTPLHVLARSLPLDIKDEELQVVMDMMNILFEYGAGWNFIDYEDKTVGDLFLERNQSRESPLYRRLVEAGVSAELLLRKLNGGDVEFLDTDELIDIEPEESVQTAVDGQKEESVGSDDDATAANQQVYLKTELEYKDDALITKENKDGVMMDWETKIMEVASETLFPDPEATNSATILNIGFGMGIIDTFIQARKPYRHYICEAHPDVLAKMKMDGWYEKDNVVILEGRWQDTLNNLLDKGEVFFDGIYYDTFSEHYQDMLDLYDVVVGLIKPEGVFSFFNGLGADRSLCYDVYKEIVEIDVATYGMKCDYTRYSLDEQLPDWNDVKRSYFNCNYYYHPRITFA